MTDRCSVSWVAESRLDGDIEAEWGRRIHSTTTTGTPAAGYSNMGFMQTVGIVSPSPGMMRVDHWWAPGPSGGSPNVVSPATMFWRVLIASRYLFNDTLVTINLSSLPPGAMALNAAFNGPAFFLPGGYTLAPTPAL